MRFLKSVLPFLLILICLGSCGSLGGRQSEIIFSESSNKPRAVVADCIYLALTETQPGVVKVDLQASSASQIVSQIEGVKRWTVSVRDAAPNEVRVEIEAPYAVIGAATRERQLVDPVRACTT